jgi:hypothetical protein
MIECIFTLDYEIYGDGQGDLRALVYEPAERLKEIFLRRGVRFVNFVEVAELERIDEAGSDAGLDAVKEQVLALHRDGFETALHIHPQWYNAAFERGRWELDYGEYNLCTLSPRRIAEIVDRALRYLRRLVGDSSYTPVAFRAGNWLFQPTAAAARVLADCGIRVDSSVFKGGLQRRHGLDYRAALANPDFWRFADDVNVPDCSGSLFELPIHTRMVPLWRMLAARRLSAPRSIATGGARGYERWRDFARVRYPLKLDFCRMQLDEMTTTVEAVLREDRRRLNVFRPVVAIGHTKDLIDLGAVDAFLSYLSSRGVGVSTFASVLPRLATGPIGPARRTQRRGGIRDRQSH